MAEILSTFPNTFQRYELSAIGFEVWGGTELGSIPESDTSPEGDPHFNIVIKVDRKEALKVCPGGEGVDLDIISGGLASFADLLRHSFYPDMSRTSYGEKENPTFTKLKVAYFGIAYTLAISRSESNLVFEAVSIQTSSEDSIILLPQNRS
ncbi:uncharacterized protein DFL_004474 [Arthrobotrys flagrans]|uniref:Uncharacterized protein n=1 Tax=Arthrobotrys flagrans TaxID=97331 RepID=A0A437A513_ARTFL|nr:hypothetical protein DFL_004474 [Arthrobotrys flagrans]